jgi:hypothetical protein
MDAANFPKLNSLRRCLFRGTPTGVRSAQLVRIFGNRLLFLAVLTSCVLALGCGGNSADGIADAEPTSDSTKQTDSQTPAPTEIVSQFLDRVRRGGEDSNASELLTKLAQQEMTRIGRPLQLPGSPDTAFEVRNSAPVPNDEKSVWVHTYLSELDESGGEIQYEVVWTLRNEMAGWRITGFVIDQGENLDPLEIDFENGNEMEARLAAMEESEDAPPR